MTGFVSSTVCRPRQICLHFGELPKWQKCGKCDLCAPLPEWLTEGASRAKSPSKRPTKEQAASLSSTDAELLEYLREWRREIARERQVSAFIILTDAALTDICRKRPLSVEELATQVSGIGARKADQFGPAILAALHRFEQGSRAGNEPRAAVISPSDETIRLLSEKKSFEEIAQIRGRRVETVVGMVAKLVEQGKIPFDPRWIRPQLLPLVESAIQELGGRWLKPIKDRVPEATFDEIRLVVAWRTKGEQIA